MSLLEDVNSHLLQIEAFERELRAHALSGIKAHTAELGIKIRKHHYVQCGHLILSESGVLYQVVGGIIEGSLHLKRMALDKRLLVLYLLGKFGSHGYFSTFSPLGEVVPEALIDEPAPVLRALERELEQQTQQQLPQQEVRYQWEHRMRREAEKGELLQVVDIY